MKLIAVGDNVTDCYLDEGIYYPGGNAVNVAVDCKRDGAEKVNYIGVFGNDDSMHGRGRCNMRALKKGICTDLPAGCKDK